MACTAGDSTERKIVFLCKGSRGDVHPLLAIALAYKREFSGDEVVLVCAPSSIGDMETTLLPEEGLNLIKLPQHKISTLEDVRRLTSDSERLSLLKSEAAICLDACKSANLIVFNLFSPEGYFIADHLGVPCLAASPHLLTRGPPSGFDVKLSQAYPDLYHRLIEAKKCGSRQTVSYSEVEHWMWRLFLEDYGEVCESLGFSSCLPFSQTQPLPPPTTLLYGISPALFPRQPYWPASVRLCGYWILHPSLHTRDPPPSLSSLVERLSDAPLLYIGFGSMETYMLDIDWEAVFTVLESALQQVQFHAIFQCQLDGSISNSHAKLSSKPERLTLWTGELPHCWLFNKCVAILHHGGAGTVATALLAKKPQIICPVMFDQEFWAEHLSWKELAVRCSSLKQLKHEELVRALRFSCSHDMAQRIEEMTCKLLQENGVDIALNEIKKILNESDMSNVTK